MHRNRNTRPDGSPFSQSIIEALWAKSIGSGNSGTDTCGTLVQKEMYGREGQYGWEIDHILPVSRGGTDDMNNLQALHWQNNRQKSDSYPWSC